MIRLNIIKFLFVSMASGVLAGGVLVNFCAGHLPAVCVQTFKYGKYSSSADKKWYIKASEVPKSWFRHFYFVAAAYSLAVAYAMLNAYVFSKPPPRTLVRLLDAATTAERTTTVNATAALLAACLFCLQIWRRLYETVRVSVYSDDGKINVLHYLVGLFHYPAALTALLSEAPQFAAAPAFFKHRTTPSASDVGVREAVAVVAFLWAWYAQYRAAVILADLRKDERGNVVSHDHRVPTGGLFDRLSSPHMFCETLMYLALGVILWGHSIWPYVFLWVFCNQCEMALLNHWWYKATFKAYPKTRKAFLPFFL